MTTHRIDGGRWAAPWFRQWPGVSAGVAAVLLVVVFLLRLSADPREDLLPVLAVLPVTLVAITFGCRAGLAAGVAALAILGPAVTVHDVNVLMWLGHSAPLVLIGGLVGAASDRLRDAQEHERRMVEMAVLQREAAEINDSIIQSLAAAKWSFEAGRVDQGLDVLTTTISTAESLVARMLRADEAVEADHPLQVWDGVPAWSVRPRLR